MTAKEAISQIKELPVISATARKLVSLLNQPDTPRTDLIKTLRCDNVLTAKVLRLCNSADAGLRHPVTSIDQAVLLLGDTALFRMVCTIGFGAPMNHGVPGYDVEANGLWGHSLSTGMAAEYIGQRESFGDFQLSVAFTAGLLHDIGKLILNQIHTPKTRTDIRNRIALESLSRVEAERSVLGVDHAEVGACLLQKWGLPEVIIEAVANHHSPVGQPAIQLSAVVYLANCAAHICASAPGSDAHAGRLTKSASNLLGIEVEKVEQILLGAHEAMKAADPFLCVA